MSVTCPTPPVTSAHPAPPGAAGAAGPGGTKALPGGFQSSFHAGIPASHSYVTPGPGLLIYHGPVNPSSSSSLYGLGAPGGDSGFGIAAALPMGWDCSSPMGWDCSSPHGLEFLLLFLGLGLFLSHGLGFLLFPLFGIPTPLPMVCNSLSFHRPCCPSPPFGSPV